jgi:hypothetical protein
MRPSRSDLRDLSSRRSEKKVPIDFFVDLPGRFGGGGHRHENLTGVVRPNVGVLKSGRGSRDLNIFCRFYCFWEIEVMLTLVE